MLGPRLSVATQFLIAAAQPDWGKKEIQFKATGNEKKLLPVILLICVFTQTCVVSRT